MYSRKEHRDIPEDTINEETTEVILETEGSGIDILTQYSGNEPNEKNECDEQLAITETTDLEVKIEAVDTSVSTKGEIERNNVLIQNVNIVGKDMTKHAKCINDDDTYASYEKKTELCRKHPLPYDTMDDHENESNESSSQYMFERKSTYI